MKLVRFLKNSTPYNAGEIAGFPDVQAAALIKAKTAVAHDPAAKPPKTPAATPATPKAPPAANTATFTVTVHQQAFLAAHGYPEVSASLAAAQAFVDKMNPVRRAKLPETAAAWEPNNTELQDQAVIDAVAEEVKAEATNAATATRPGTLPIRPAPAGK